MRGMVWQLPQPYLPMTAWPLAHAAAGERFGFASSPTFRIARRGGGECDEHDELAARAAASVAPKRTRRSASPSHAASSARPKTMKITPAGIHISRPASC